MRRLGFTTVASIVVLALAPTSALARRHHHQRNHSHSHHARNRTRVFGAATGPTTGTGAPSDTAGTVQSFDSTTGVLVITLNDNSTVSGTVTSETELECSAAQASTSGSPGGSWGDDGDMGGAPGGGEDTQGSGGDEGQNSCTTAALTPGAVVQSAELVFSGSGATWEKVELVGPASTTTGSTSGPSD